jgi:DNA invertase Pin-like site-specific DNA recombinase
VPFGWRKAKASEDEKGYGLEPVPEEQDAINRMIAMKAEGKSLRAIRDTIRAEGFNVSHVTVGRVLDAA